MDDSYYLFNFFTTMLIFLCIVLLPYYLHTHLRKNNIRNIVISWLHILISSVLILAILSILTYIPPINRNWRYSPVQSPHFSNWILFNDIALVLFGILLFIQIVYLIYGFSKIRKHKEQIKYNQPEVEVILYNRDEVFINPAL
jgi:quinol-cytochrome oxidoreductase complex cytochrome b subunit